MSELIDDRTAELSEECHSDFPVNLSGENLKFPSLFSVLVLFAYIILISIALGQY